MRRNYSLSLFHRHRHYTPVFFSTQINPPPFPPHQPLNNHTNTLQTHAPNPNNSDPLHYLQSFYTLFETLSKNPKAHNSLTTLDSFLTQINFFNSLTSLILVHYLSQIKKIGRAKSVISNLRTKGKISDYFLYSFVIDCLVRDGKINDVENVWNEVCGSRLQSIGRIDISDYVIYVCKFGGFGEIRGICERILMGEGVLGKQSYAALIGTLCRENEGFLAKDVVRDMFNKGFKVDDLTYFVMFKCFCRNGDLNEADLILRVLVKRKFHIDICIYGSFMHALCKSGKFREANKLFCKLIKRDCVGGSKKVQFLKEGRRAIFQLNCEGTVPEVMAYETYFRLLCNVGRLDEAEVLLKKMMKSRTVPEICVYGFFMKALFRAGRDEDAMKFFNVERKKRLVRVDDIARYIIMGLCDKGKVDDALRIFEEILLIGEFVNCLDVCNCILGSYWREGRVAEAESLFERLQDGNFELPDVQTYTIMVNGYCNQGTVSKALRIFEDMLNRKMVVNGTLYEIIIRGLCACGRLKEALEYLNDMIENGHLVSYKRWKVLFYSTFTAVEDGILIGFRTCK